MAKKKNLFEELQRMATQSVGPVQTNPATADDIVNQSAVQKVNQITELASKMYPEDMNSRFDFWKSRLDVSQLPQGGKQAYWSTYQTMHPEGIDGATRDFVTTTRKELDYIPGMAEKEFFLRERIAQTPDWAKKQLEPILAEVSTTVANANYNKAQQVYASDLQTRVNAFLSNQQLDPDVAIDDHVNDMLKLEQMNLMEMASVMNGRVGIMKDGRSFVPAFGMTNSEQIVKDAAIAPSIEEQTVVQELARLPIKTAVADNVTSSRIKIKGQEETAKNIAQQQLRTGKYDMDQWDKAFSIMPDVSMQDKVMLGLRGEITSGRIKTEKQLAQSIYQAISTYGNELLASFKEKEQTKTTELRFDSNFETILTDKEELLFTTWKKKYAPNDSGEDYDLRGAFKSGFIPDANGHWPDTFKKPSHPTFSTESKYAELGFGKPGKWFDKPMNNKYPTGAVIDENTGQYFLK